MLPHGCCLVVSVTPRSEAARLTHSRCPQGALSQDTGSDQAAAGMLASALAALEQQYSAAVAAAPAQVARAGSGAFARAAAVFLEGQVAMLRAALSSCSAWQCGRCERAPA
jgi:hypothetical protein